MKHLKKYNELVEYKDTVDPTADVEQFKEKFSKMLSKNDIRLLDVILARFPTQTDEWRVYDVGMLLDDRGQRAKNICYVKAVSANHAKLKAALTKGDREIFSTGFYAANLISDMELDKREKEKLEKLNKIKAEIENIKNPL